MTFPFYLGFGAWAVHPHLVFECLGFLTAWLVYRRQRRLFGDTLPSSERARVLVAAALGAVVGSKLLHWLENPLLTWSQRHDLLYLMGGKTIVGGLLGGLLAVEWSRKRRGLIKASGDLFAIPLALGISVGRLGCFLTGLDDADVGMPTHLPWGVNFGDGIPRHPTQLYELCFALALAWALTRLRFRMPRQGDLFKLFMVSYLGFRLVVDFIKPVLRFGGLTVIQWAALFGLAWYARDIVRWVHDISGLDRNAQQGEQRHTAPGNT